MKAIITGIGWVTAAGSGWGSQGGGFAMTGGTLPPLTRKEVFAEPNQRFGRQSEYSKVGVAAIAFALRDAGLESWTEKRPVGMVASTLLGCLATDVDYFRTVREEGGGLASPNLFAYTLSNCFLGEAAIQFGLTGSGVIVNEAGPEALAGVRLALESLSWGESDTILAGICNLPAPPGYREGDGPPPGAAFLVLETEAAGREPVYGSIELADDGSIHHNGSAVPTFVGLVEGCLQLRP